MAHGATDYSNIVKPEFTHRVDDMGELAARLTQTTSLDRRGEVIFWDDFKFGLSKWDKGSSGTNGNVILISDDVHSDGFAVRLKAGSDASKLAKIWYTFPFLATSKIGLEARVKIGSNTDRIVIYFYYYDGANLFTGVMSYSVTLQAIQIKNSLGAYVTVKDNVKSPPPGDSFSFFKLVIDLTNTKFVRVLFNGHNVNVSSYAILTSVDTTAPKCIANIEELGNAGVNGESIVDTVIITRNE